MITKNCKFIK